MQCMLSLPSAPRSASYIGYVTKLTIWNPYLYYFGKTKQENRDGAAVFYFFLELAVPVMIVTSLDKSGQRSELRLPRPPREVFLGIIMSMNIFDPRLPCRHWPRGAGLDMCGLHTFFLLRWTLAWPELPATCFSSMFPLGL